jgi:hypothetical protein
MRRGLLHVAAAVSLMLCLAVMVLWVRSFWVGEQWYVSRTKWSAVPDDPRMVRWSETAGWLITGRGGLAVEVRTQSFTAPRADAPGPKIERSWRLAEKPVYPEAWPTDTLPRRLGFGYWVATYNNVTLNRRVWAPAWFVVALTALLPALDARLLVRARRARRVGRCFSCGYDLRGTSGGRCPECGAERPVESAPTS